MRTLSSEEVLECIDLIRDSLKVGIDIEGIKEELYETYSDVEPMEIDEIVEKVNAGKILIEEFEIIAVGKTCKEVATLTGLTMQEVYRMACKLEKLGKKNPLKRDHVGRKKGYNGKTKIDICIEMLNNGYTYKQIAKQLGIKVTTVEQYKRDYNRKHHKPNRTYHKRPKGEFK